MKNTADCLSSDYLLKCMDSSTIKINTLINYIYYIKMYVLKPISSIIRFTLIIIFMAVIQQQRKEKEQNSFVPHWLFFLSSFII